MNNDIKISVIIACKNAASFIETAIKSVIEQSYKNYELIVIDGASTDGTLDILEKYRSSIHYLYSAPDKSAGEAQNRGMDVCTGDLIVFLFADDWFEPDGFQAVVKTFSENPTADIISCGVRHVEKTNGEIRIINTYNTEELLSVNLKNMLLPLVNISGKFFSKPFVKKLGYFIEQAQDKKSQFFGNDLDYLIRAVFLKPHVILLPQICHTYLAHAGSYNFGARNTFVIQILEERISLALTYLADETVSSNDKRLLKAWLIDQEIRLHIRRLISHKKTSFKNSQLWKHPFLSLRIFLKILLKSGTSVVANYLP